MALPKTLKYLLCYLPFILVGTGLVVFGVFQDDSARIASLIVGVVVLFSGLFAWCTDTDVGCFVVCSCWSNKDRKLKIKKNSKSTGAGIEVENDIFTIHTNKGATSPQTTASKKTKSAVNNNDDQTTTTGGKDEHFRENKMIQRDRHNNYGQYSLYQQKDEEGYGNGTMDRNGRKPRFPTRAPSLDNYLNGYKPNGIHGRQEMRLTVRNLQKLDKIRQHHQSFDSDPQMYSQANNPAMNNEAFELEFSLSIQKRESIKNWITDVHHSRENVSMMPDQQQQPQGPQTWIQHQKGYDSNKIQRKPLPREPANDRYSSTASGSAIDIEVHSLPRSFGSDGNKSPTGTLDRIDSPDQSPQQQEFELSGYIVSEENQVPPRQPATILEAVINDQYV